MTPRLLLFGAPAVVLDGAVRPLPFERRHQLLVLLALRSGWMARADVAAMLWPGQETRLALANVRKALFRLQEAPWGAWIESAEQALRVAVATDVGCFEGCLREHRQADALRWRRGELLAGFDDDGNEAWTGWLRFERERLRSAWRAATLERLAGDLEANEGLALAADLLAADPLDEAAVAARITWLTRTGQSGAARQAYQAYAARLHEDLGLSPGAELAALLPGTTSPPTSQPRPASPSAGTFVGRAVELRAIAQRLDDPACRLLCLVGPGGVGKTRLARRALDDFGSRFADGAAFVALDDVPSTRDMGSRLAQVVGAERIPDGDAFGAAIAAIGARRMLLVLDNFEHLAHDAAVLDRLLQGCPQLTLLVTSRVRPGVPGEQLMPVAGLPCPEDDDRDRLEAFDAARLFVQAARRVEPAFLPGAEAEAIVDICRQVDGLPLALELAAAWTRVLSCAAIADELRAGTTLLQTVDAAHPPRHASIEVVFDQSWHHLAPAEQEVLSALSMFRGSFTPEAARVVAGASLPVLGALVDKSLVRKDGARLSLHPLVQQLATLRLEGERRDRVAQAHARYTLQWVAHLGPGARKGDGGTLQQLDSGIENVRTAWQWAAAHGGADLLKRAYRTLLDLWDLRGRSAIGLEWFRDSLESPAARDDRVLSLLLLAAIAYLESRLDRYADAESTARSALDAWQPGDGEDSKLQCLVVLGTCALRLGRHDEARRWFRRALDETPAKLYPSNAAAMLDNLALIEKELGRYDDSLALSMRSLAEHRELRDVAGEALCLNNIADLHLVRREYDLAELRLREGLALCESHGLANTEVLVLANLAEVALCTGRDGLAAEYATRALALCETSGHRAVGCWVRLLQVRLDLRSHDLASARRRLAASLGDATVIGAPWLQLAGMLVFGDLLDAAGDADAAAKVRAGVAGHPGATASQRAEAQARLPVAPAATPDPWAGLDVDALAHRIVAEADVGHARLVATLTGAGQRTGA